MLALACGARLGGARRASAIAAWGRHDGVPSARALGFRPRPPGAATLHLMFRRMDGAAFEAQRGAWAEAVMASLPPGTGRPSVAEPAVALEGNTLRGSRTPGVPGVHVRSARAPQVGVTRAPPAVADQTPASTAVETGLRQRVLTGRVGTLEARRTPTAVAPTLVEAGGDSGMRVNAPPPPPSAQRAS